MKDKYIELIEKNYEGNAKKILLEQVNSFFEKVNIKKNKYAVGEDVFLKKGTYMHGIPGELDNFDWIVNNGFIGNEFTNNANSNKIKASIGMWDIQKDCYLKDYINLYSGFTICYTIGRGPGSNEVCEMIPYHKFDEYTEMINNREDVWMYWGDQTKEIRFMPSLVADKRQIAFIINTDNPLAKKMLVNDVWNTKMDEETLKSFLDYRYYEKFLEERFNRNALSTDRETAIMFGLPPSLIEGVFVGRKIEKDKEKLDYIKSKLPDCYICNLDGKVIVGNK